MKTLNKIQSLLGYDFTEYFLCEEEMYEGSWTISSDENY